MGRIWNKKWIQAAVCAVVCAAILTVIALLSGGKSDVVSSAVGAVASPLRTVMSAFADRAEVIFEHEEMVEELKKENSELRGTIAKMEDSTAQVAALERKVDSLNRLLEMRTEHKDMALTQTSFVTWTSTNYTEQFTINSGSRDDVSVGDCVITEAGYMVGVVSKVTAGTATVTAITDANSSISVNVGSGESVAILAGDMELMPQRLMRLNYITEPSAVRTDDVVTTRSGGNLYPAGLVMGRVARVAMEDTGLSAYAIVVPAADMDALDTLYVVTDFEEPEE